MAKTEYKVGEIFQFGLKTLKCVEGTSCKECMFYLDVWDSFCLHNDHIEYVGPCVKKYRKDRTDVIFIEVEETDKQEGDKMKQTLEEAAHLFAESRSSGSMFPAYYDGFMAGAEWKLNQPE